jgi:ABC-type sugar transport system substrate-binding protein
MKVLSIWKASNALALAVAFGATAVLGVTLGSTQVLSQEKFTIGVSVWDVSSTPFTVPLLKGMQAAADDAGVKLIISDPKWDASTQVDNLREFVVQKVDAIAVAPIDVGGVLPVVRETLKAGIPVVGALGEIEGIPYIGVDDVEYGRLSARLMLQAMAGIDGTKRVVMFRGTAGGSPDRLRMQGMTEVFEAENADIEWVHVTADWLPDKALTGFQDVLQRFPTKGSITLVNSIGNCMIPPSLDWAKRQGRDEIRFVSIDLCQGEEEAIGAGDMYGSVYQDPLIMGRLVVNSIVAMRDAGNYDMLPVFAANPPIGFCTQSNYADCKGRGF